MSLVHEVPTGLRTRPTVTIRAIPGRAIRLPARAGTLLLGAVLIWGGCASLTPLPWLLLAGIILAPASLVAALVELQPRGRTPLAWLYVLSRQLRRPAILIVTRSLASRHTLAGRRRSRTAAARGASS